VIVEADFTIKSQEGAKKVWIFFPCVLFGLTLDMQIIISTWQYKPVAFDALPYKCCKTLMLIFAFASLLISILSYGLCMLVFGGMRSDYRKLMFGCLLAKAVTWSPFLGMEFYDTVFEQIYHDVQFQINVIRPDGTTSPAVGRRTNSRGS
jgi:NO-binding membrane sensor protein with MHYT domain